MTSGLGRHCPLWTKNIGRINYIKIKLSMHMEGTHTFKQQKTEKVLDIYMTEVEFSHITVKVNEITFKNTIKSPHITNEC
jgi:hypothetical protein